MKKYLNYIIILLAFTSVQSCNSDDNNSYVSDKIKIISTNVNSDDIPDENGYYTNSFQAVVKNTSGVGVPVFVRFTLKEYGVKDSEPKSIDSSESTQYRFSVEIESKEKLTEDYLLKAEIIKN